jgi:hypothetical protein
MGLGLSTRWQDAARANNYATRDDDTPFFCDAHERWHRQGICPECWDEGKADYLEGLAEDAKVQRSNA